MFLFISTATVERSFSTLRRVKTWFRSTIGEERLSGLCLMSVHRKFVNENRKMIEKEIVEKFAENPRRLLLLQHKKTTFSFLNQKGVKIKFYLENVNFIAAQSTYIDATTYVPNIFFLFMFFFYLFTYFFCII